MIATKERTVTSFTTPSDREITMTRVFNAPRALVFEAHTDPRHPPRWMLGPDGWTMTVCEIDLRVGGEWHFVWSNTDGSAMEMRGIYQEVRPPARLVNTESWGGEYPETVNTMELTEEDGRTTLTTTMLFPTKAARDAALGTGMKAGIELSYKRLAKHLESLA